METGNGVGTEYIISYLQILSISASKR